MAKDSLKHFGKLIIQELMQGNLSSLKDIKYFQRWKKSLQHGRNAIIDRQPWITFPVIDILSENIHANTKIFEYGGGGSTLFFVNRAKEVITIEHHEEWFAMLEKEINIKSSKNWTGNLILPEKHSSTLNLDPSEPFHYYTNDEAYLDSTFKSYASHIDRFPDNYFDIVLVDGRSRPSCIWHCMPKIKAGGILVIDNSNRSYYFKALNKELNTGFKLIYNSKAASPYSNFFTQTGIWRKL